MSAEQKTYPSQFEKVKAITDQLEAGIQALFESDKFKQYLKTLSKFHDYSLNNTILIAMQKPDATLVAGYTAWQKQFGRQVQKGENGIRILAPTPYKKKMEVEKTDPVTGEILTNPDGTSVKETKEVLMPAFKVVNVWHPLYREIIVIMSYISTTMKQPASESRNGKASRLWPMQSVGKLRLNIGRK